MSVPKPIRYETKLSAAHNVVLKIIRQICKQSCHCIAFDKNDKRKFSFDGTYLNIELKKIP